MTTKPRVKPLEAAMTVLSCLGVIWGDIGTSPLYSYSSIYKCEEECEQPQRDDVLQTFSCIFWTLTLVTLVKYILIVLRMDYHGEGGIFALLLNATRNPRRACPAWVGRVLVIMAAIGASAMMADGFITPALSVLSAIEGLRSSDLMSPSQIDVINKVIVPVTCVILLILFASQKFGSTKVGRVFGPIMLIYFFSLGGIGIYNLVSTGNVFVLEGLSPVYTVRFFFTGRFSGYQSFKKLSSLVLCVTGAEALYADLGHFSKSAIYFSWGLVVYPCLILAYAGQAAMMISNPAVVTAAFWNTVPKPVYIPMLIVSTLATVVASQAMITGSFSLASQAVMLSLFPRVRVVNTDPRKSGQIFIPELNILLCIGTILLVIGFQSSAALAGAYGISVVLTFNITTLLLGAVLYTVKWPNTRLLWIMVAIFPMLFMDMAFLASNVYFKFTHGGWITLLITAVISSIMLCWWYGRILTARARELDAKLSVSTGNGNLATFDSLSEAVLSGRIKRGHGIGVFLTPTVLKVGKRINLSSLMNAKAAEEGNFETANGSINRMKSNVSAIVPESDCALPSSLGLYLRVTGSIQRVVVILHIQFDHDRPAISIGDRVSIEEVVTGSGVGIYSATVRFGFAEPLSEVDMSKIVRQWVLEQIPMHRSLSDLFDPSQRSEADRLWYFLYKEEHAAMKGSNIFRRALVWLYSALHTVSRSAYVFLNLPATESIQLGGCVTI